MSDPKDPNRNGLEAAEAFRLIAHHFERSADLLDLGRNNEAKYHYERGGYWASTLIPSEEASGE